MGKVKIYFSLEKDNQGIDFYLQYKQAMHV